ncbi:MAG: aminoacyl-tRNA deacylase [Candidatus Tectimicrobiota bacterium]
MTKKLNSMRFLESHGVSYTVLTFPETIHSATGVAAHCGLPPEQVYKTLVVILSQGKPALVMVPGDRELQLKRLAHALGEKKLRMATQQEAETWTGLKVGGISALALTHRGFPVYLDHTALALETIFVSAGQRGLDVRVGVADLCRVTGAIPVEATTL